MEFLHLIKLIDSYSKILSLHKNLFITIKPHPILPISKIDKNFNQI